MHSAKIIERCDLCGERFQYGPVAYFGTYVPAYQVMVCHRCYAANWDGWALKLDQTVTRNLKAKGIRIPERDTKGSGASDLPPESELLRLADLPSGPVRMERLALTPSWPPFQPL